MAIAGNTIHVANYTDEIRTSSRYYLEILTVSEKSVVVLLFRESKDLTRANAEKQTGSRRRETDIETDKRVNKPLDF